MLQITSNAAQLVNAAREEQGVPGHFGLRVFAESSPQGAAVRVAFTEAPAEGDEIAESEGTKLFVAPELAQQLDDAVIDAEPSGAGLVFRQGEES